MTCKAFNARVERLVANAAKPIAAPVTAVTRREVSQRAEEQAEQEANDYTRQYHALEPATPAPVFIGLY